MRASDAPPPPPRTKWTRRVPHPVLIGHAASRTPYRGRSAAAAGSQVSLEEALELERGLRAELAQLAAAPPGVPPRPRPSD